MGQAPKSQSSQQLTVDAEEVARRKRLVNVEAEDLKRIASVAKLVVAAADELTDGFFKTLSGLPEAKGLFASSALLEEARRLKKEHLIAMVSGDLRGDYAEGRLKLARVYSRAGLDTNVFLGALRLLLEAIGELIMKKSRLKPDEAFAAFLSLTKVAFFDIGLIMDSLVLDRENTIRRQQEAIRELSTPVLTLRERLIILPIVGMIDTFRARTLTESLLQAIRDRRAKVVVMDITGVATVDSKVANHLVQTVSACRLMGARVYVTGLSADIAQTLVTLGADLGKLNTVGDLQGGIEEAERYLGLRVVQDAPVAAQ